MVRARRVPVGSTRVGRRNPIDSSGAPRVSRAIPTMNVHNRFRAPNNVRSRSASTALGISYRG